MRKFIKLSIAVMVCILIIIGCRDSKIRQGFITGNTSEFSVGDILYLGIDGSFTVHNNTPFDSIVFVVGYDYKYKGYTVIADTLYVNDSMRIFYEKDRIYLWTLKDSSNYDTYNIQIHNKGFWINKGKTYAETHNDIEGVINFLIRNIDRDNKPINTTYKPRSRFY